LLLATAFAIETNTPLIYTRLKAEGTGQRGVEGRYRPGARALLVDDLATGGNSITQAARFLSEHDIAVHDAVALVDRQMGARARLKHAGVNLISILTLDVMMNLYYESNLITEQQHSQYLTYARASRDAEASDESGEPNGGETPTNGHDPTGH
jgi:orotate phosphoribosyltransferase/uridine monophosphate synthetase